MYKTQDLTVLFSENNLKKLMPKVIYFLFFLAISPIAVFLIYITLFLFYIISQLSFGIESDLFSELSSLVWFIIPIILLAISYKSIGAIKNVYKYFIVTFIILLISYILYFHSAITFATSNIVNLLSLVFLGLVYITYLSALLTYFWKRIIKESQSKEALLLIISFLVIGACYYLKVTSSSLETYILWGEFILKSFHINIFYLDYGGFVIIYMSFIFSITALVSNFLLRIFNSRKSHKLFTPKRL